MFTQFQPVTLSRKICYCPGRLTGLCLVGKKCVVPLHPDRRKP
ncbi:hypothetical protein CKO_01451 [Citrobacter koseri ATCC BAA-895]|uniref:Uncharacterized protein n=1 Tax=Citrobacter koseri (strain ATCC BAA-895 / CDC 4225-83 / SGSC4696) TaxID=290338 RepID=A8AGH2_CITK8|nr:hypothetical protein CKO_01451 [Citrobacter koseri ATCC BAA-895]